MISLLLAVTTVTLSSCGAGSFGAANGNNNQNSAAQGGLLGNLIGAATNEQTIGNLLQSVLGLDKMAAGDLIGTWRYAQPGCAFTSEQLLAQAGGEVMATDIKNKMASKFQALGINASTTDITFDKDGNFTAHIAGKPLVGTYTFDAKTYQVNLKTLLLTLHCYAKKTPTGIALLFEANKLTTMVKTLAAKSSNTTLQALSQAGNSYNGLRIGFEMTK